MKKERIILNQAQAARAWLPNPCKRQRIFELIKAGRFTVPIDDQGNEKRGCVYLDEVVNFKEKPKGRPRLTEKELIDRGLTGFSIGDAVIWDHQPKDGYSYFVHIPGIVIKMGAKRLKLKLELPRGTAEVWANRTACRLASAATPQPIGKTKNKLTQIPDSGIDHKEYANRRMAYSTT